jgi:hypothetical protein
MQGDPKQVIPWIRVVIGFYNLFLCIAWWWRWVSKADRCFLERRSVSLTSYCLSFKSPTQWPPWLLLAIGAMKSVQ